MGLINIGIHPLRIAKASHLSTQTRGERSRNTGIPHTPRGHSEAPSPELRARGFTLYINFQEVTNEKIRKVTTPTIAPCPARPQGSGNANIDKVSVSPSKPLKSSLSNQLHPNTHRAAHSAARRAGAYPYISYWKVLRVAHQLFGKIGWGSSVLVWIYFWLLRAATASSASRSCVKRAFTPWLVRFASSASMVSVRFLGSYCTRRILASSRYSASIIRFTIRVIK